MEEGMSSFSWTDDLKSGAPRTSPWVEVCLCSYAIASKRLDFCLLFHGSRSALQHLSNWTSAVDETSISILLKLKKISQNYDAHLQWIPSHVNVSGNELADSLVKKGSEDETATGSSITYQELYTNERSKLNLSWRNPPVCHWYTRTSPLVPF
ncbi:RNase H domain-containing protein [Trichonephila clavipes]|nr:RNase H domain-containing protein [Trichonephila clavipes]